ncbi:tRNA uridine-5-carboxymethylaminomethyl(34) synthesis GTPase MnmE [Sandarakinorhabdus cyanobacteriorum]|uniref:tRNA modification GTPase MnmE n=1 Tax=Sandarakinorhabdus cyanobacteriorum TaxID=1981098 RepID=A0A255YRR2_9SPHN|nr:tRNA uridine-5-carboxymethylaminomethyl(34) synthesis GTPase MnmE [Sandarakinorhabdus cyanobacteriorum]OYQ31110.1 tRNA uridine-5-carboxymethylaminomethyl(34) synthesis GTPase MnmE [Sandarakinorhabdus cyanobacteriorum]
MTDTIAALASGRPPAALAIIRISGPAAFAVVQQLAGRVPPPRRLSLCRLHHDGQLLDEALVAVFPGPASASGEDLAELHLHGGPAVVAGVLDAVTAQPGVRLAEPGEYTRRAFASGRMDLTQVEGLADLVSAETASQRDQALALAGGALGRLADQWRDRCLNVLAEAEAGLDFAEDEADVAERLDEAARDQLADMADELAALIADSARAMRIRDGLTIAVTGPPNVGKSSLVNALAMRDVAIVTAIPGTTRDAIEVPIDLNGVAAVLIDTAGLRDTDDPVEAIGIARARARAASADLVISVASAEAPQWTGDGALRLLNKCDLAAPDVPPDVLAVSATTGAGLPALRDWLSHWAHNLIRPGEPALLSHARHRAAFADAESALGDAAMASEPVLRAEALRAAAHAFGRIAGRVGVDDVLDRIFSRFCVGK